MSTITLGRWIKNLARLSSSLDEDLSLLLSEVAEDAQDRAADNLSGRVLHVRSGRLRASVRTAITRRGDGIELHLSAGGGSVNYARIHEFGGRIEGNPRLLFRLPDGGWRSPVSVTIPKRPYLRPALEEAAGGLEARITKLFERLEEGGV